VSIWQDYHLFEKIEFILCEDAEYYGSNHMGFPFMSAYQLAISLAEKYPDILKALGMPLGGSETGQRNSFSQYVARELSKHIHSGEITSIEGGFLSNTHLKDIQFEFDDQVIHSSLTGTKYTLSLFRWIG